MKIECILKRKGGSHVEMPGKKYHFAPQEDGRHVADVTVDAHIERFLSISEAYRILRAPGADAAEAMRVPASAADNPAPFVLGPGETLLGADGYPATFDIDGRTYQLGDVVLRAFQDSGLTVVNWNELDDDARSTKLDIVLDGLEAGEITIDGTAATPPADERTQLDAQYKTRFGKAPPSNMKIETLRAKLAAGLE